MVSISKINKNFQTIEKYLKVLDEFKIDSSEVLENNIKDSLAVSMSCFTILNAVIEIGESLITIKDLEFPSTYKEIFSILGKNKILSKKLSLELEKYMYLRNMLAHQYDDMEYDKIYDLYVNREIFRKFIVESKIYFN